MFKIEEIIKQAKGFSIDSRTISPGDCFIAIKGKNFDGHDFIGTAIKKGARAVIAESSVVSHQSSVTVPLIKVKDTIKTLGEIAGYLRLKYDIPVVAITGTTGKTTAKEMIAWVLSAKFKVLKNEGTKNNHIGLSLALSGLNKSHDIAVLELGTNHFGEIAYLAEICRPNIALITNIGPGHLEYFGDVKAVLREKYSLTDYLKNPAAAFLNADDNLLRKKILKKQTSPRVFSFGMENPADFFASGIKAGIKGLEFSVNRKYKFILNAIGRHNIHNALGAIGIARLFGMNYDEIASRLRCFCLPAGRLNLIRLKGIRFLDDTYNANPLSLENALKALRGLDIAGRKIFVMGDMLELGALSKKYHLAAGIQASRACDVFLTVGRQSRLAAKAARNSGLSVKSIFTCENCRQAKDILFKRITPDKDDVVLVKGSRGIRMEEIIK